MGTARNSAASVESGRSRPRWECSECERPYRRRAFHQYTCSPECARKRKSRKQRDARAQVVAPWTQPERRRDQRQLDLFKSCSVCRKPVNRVRGKFCSDECALVANRWRARAHYLVNRKGMSLQAAYRAIAAKPPKTNEETGGHGKVSTYNVGCRCAECREAKSTYVRQRRENASITKNLA